MTNPNTLPATPDFPLPETGDFYRGQPNAEPSMPYGVRLDVSWANPVDRLLGIGYLEAARQADITNIRVIPTETFEDIATFSNHYPTLRHYFTTPIEKFVGRILVGNAYEVCGRESDKTVAKSVALTSWEGKKVPKYVVGALSEFAEVWVPRVFAQELFLQAGVKSPVYVVEPTMPTWVTKNYEGREERVWYKNIFSKTKPTPYGFLILAVEALRDEALPVVKAFVDTFSRQDPTVLYVATPRQHWPPLREFLAKLGKADDQAPMVLPVSVDWTDPNQFGQLLQQVDCIVSTDLCGGWELPPRIAEANGIGTVLSVGLEDKELGDLLMACQSHAIEPAAGLPARDLSLEFEHRWKALGWALP